MSNQLYSLQNGHYYPVFPVLPVAVSHLPPNPLQRFATFVEENYPLPSHQISNPSALPQVPLERTTLIAQNTFWGVPQQAYFSYFAPPASPMPPPSMSQRPALPPQPPAAALPASRKRLNPTAPPPREVAPARVKQKKVDSKPEKPMATPAMRQDREQMIRMRIYEGMSLMEQHKFPESMHFFRHIFSLETEPSPSFVFQFMAASQQMVDKIRPQILKYVESALALNPNDPSSLILNGLCHISPGQYQIAEKIFRFVAVNNPADSMAKTLLTEVSLMNRRGVSMPLEVAAPQIASVKSRMAISVLLN